MTVQYMNPLSRGWDRMKSALFRPFDFGKWLAVGFTAFLAGLLDWPHSGNGGDDGAGGKFDIDEILDFPYVISDWAADNPGWFALIVFGVFFFICLGILLNWLSSRGKFMFLDNVAHDHSLIGQPWNEYSAQGNSLFVWRLAYHVIVLVVILTLLVFGFFTAVRLHDSFASTSTIIITAVGFGMAFLAVILLFAYVSLFLNDFVVPLQYKNRISAARAS